MPNPKKYKAKYTGNLFDTREEAIADNKKYFSDVNYRYWIKSSKVKHPKEYDIPFIESKRRTLTNAGLATGAVISENILDTIAKYANAAGLPVKTAIGLAVKESTLGNPTDDTSIYSLLNKEDIQWFKNRGTGQHINKKGETIYPRDLVNFYVDKTNPYEASMNYAAAKATNKKNPDLFRSMLEAGERYADVKAKEYENVYGNNHVLHNAFKFYKEHPDKYNPGQPNYQQLVNKRADEVWNSPEIQNWYKTYRKRSLENGGK